MRTSSPYRAQRRVLCNSPLPNSSSFCHARTQSKQFGGEAPCWHGVFPERSAMTQTMKTTDSLIWSSNHQQAGGRHAVERFNSIHTSRHRRFAGGVTRLVCIAATALAGLVNFQSVQAANIVWVSDSNDPATGFFGPLSGQTDSAFVTLLQNAGHNVIRYNPPVAVATLL